MTFQKRLIISVSLILLLAFGGLEYFLYQSVRQAGLDSLRTQADRIHYFIMSMRRVYQQQFLKSGLGVTDQTVGFLPAHSLNRISKDYAGNWDRSGFSVNTVSDAPRNPQQQADAVELAAMDYFRANDDVEYGQAALDQGLSLKLICHSSDVRVIGDRTRIEQVMKNLIGNALKFTHEGEVNVRLESREMPEDHLALTLAVQDSGIGIPVENRAMIFDKFSQADSSITRRYGGSGLGLSICRQILRMMGSELEVESEPGHGSTFSFTLVLPRAEPEGQGKEGDAAQSAIARPLHGKPLLLAEDDRSNQLIIQKMLEMLGQRVDIAENGEKAVALAKTGDYAAVFLDLRMPVMDGLTAAREIRRFNADFPLIALTASVLPGDADRCREAGMNDYLSKPLALEELRSIVEKWLER